MYIDIDLDIDIHLDIDLDIDIDIDTDIDIDIPSNQIRPLPPSLQQQYVACHLRFQLFI